MTRTLVDGDDPGFAHPTKPVGRYLPEDQARALIEHGQAWEDRGAKGWRRVVASPEPIEVLDAPTIDDAWPTPGTSWSAPAAAASRSCATPTARCAGSRPSSTRTSRPRCSARHVGADVLVIATDVEHVVLGYGTDDERAAATG